MLSTVLKSDRAITINIRIMRAFVQLREMLASNKELARRFAQLETRLDKKLTMHDEAIAAILSAIRQLMHPPVPKRRRCRTVCDAACECSDKQRHAETINRAGNRRRIPRPSHATIDLGLGELFYSHVVLEWSGRWESNPRLKLGKLGYYHYTTPAQRRF
jgi:hypothetical protein